MSLAWLRHPERAALTERACAEHGVDLETATPRDVRFVEFVVLHAVAPSAFPVIPSREAPAAPVRRRAITSLAGVGR